jgi:hypothetical protein
LSKGTSTSRGQDIALKANKKDKSKKVVQESSSSDNDSDSSSLYDDDMALLMKNFSKLMRNRNYKGNKRHESSKRRTKKIAIIVARVGTSLQIAHMRRKRTRKRRGRTTRRRSTSPRTRSSSRRNKVVKHILARSGTPMMRAPTRMKKMWPHLLLTRLLSSPTSRMGKTSLTLVLWQGEVKER